MEPIRTRKPPLPSSHDYVVVELQDARYWAKFASGEMRVSLWSEVVRKLEKADKDGRAVECRWYKMSDRRHPVHAHGHVEVVAVEPLPRVKVRSRSQA